MAKDLVSSLTSTLGLARVRESEKLKKVRKKMEIYGMKSRNLTTIKKYKVRAALIELGFKMENIKMQIIEKSEAFKYVNEIQASKILGISQSKIKYLRSQGKIGYVKIGKSIRYKIEQLERYVQQGVVEAQAPIIHDF